MAVRRRLVLYGVPSSRSLTWKGLTGTRKSSSSSTTCATRSATIDSFRSSNSWRWFSRSGTRMRVRDMSVYLVCLVSSSGFFLLMTRSLRAAWCRVTLRKTCFPRL